MKIFKSFIFPVFSSNCITLLDLKYLVSVSWRLSVCRCHFYQQEFLRDLSTVQCSVVCTVTVSECGVEEGVWLQSVKTSPDSPYTALTAGDRRHRFHLKPQYLFLSAAKIALFTHGHSDSVITDNRPTTHNNCVELTKLPMTLKQLLAS